MNADRQFAADVLIDNGKIVKLGSSLEVAFTGTAYDTAGSAGG